MITKHGNSIIITVAAERSEAAPYSSHVVGSPESTPTSISRDLCIVDISILCPSVWKDVVIQGESLKVSGTFV